MSSTASYDLTGAQVADLGSMSNAAFAEKYRLDRRRVGLTRISLGIANVKQVPWNAGTGTQPGRGPERVGVERQGDKLTVVGEPGESLGDIQALLRRRGINPDDWIVERVVVNEWETPAFDRDAGAFVQVTNHQLKVTLLPRLHLLIPTRADPDGPRFYSRAAEAISQEAKLVAILPDQQIPYHDKRLHECVLGWLEYNRPDRGVISGDACDLPTVSTHPPKGHERHTTLQGGINQTYNVLREYIEAAGGVVDLDQLGGADWEYVPGNHEMRFQKAILRNFPQLYGLAKADESATVLSLPHLLRLDELGVKWAADPVYEEDYPQGHVTLNKNLAVYHGWLAKQNSGATALTTLEHLGHSVVVGHTHRQGQVFHTYHEIGGELRVLTGVEAGTLAVPRGGLGYSVAPNWQQGFATAWLHPDGTFKLELASYVNGVLLWGEQRFEDGKAA